MAVTFIFAFLAVLALIGVAAWLVRRFASNRLGTNTNRGRMPRLAVIDAAAVDGRRRLVLVRRDNIEHLLMIGGPSDIVVESNIVRASPAREQLAPRPGIPPGMPAPEPQRVAPLPDTAWNEAESARESFDHHEPPLMPEPPQRPARPSFADELRRPPAAPVERRSEPLTGFAPEPLGSRPEPRPELRPEPPRPESIAPRAEPRAEPVLPRMPAARSEPVVPRPVRAAAEMPKVPPLRTPERAAPPPPPLPPPAPPPAMAAPPPTPPPPAQSADQNLAEMAQRLEAALRRPAGAMPAPDVAPPVAPEPPVRERAAVRSEPPIPPPAPATSPKTSFEKSGRRDGIAAGSSEVVIFVRPANLPRRVLFIAVLIAAGSLATAAFAQDISINLGPGNGGVTERAIQLIALLTVLSIAPSILIMMTSFTRIVVVLSLLRTAMGTATAPPNTVIIALAVFLTAFVMGPVLQKSYDDGIKPLINNEISVEEALQRASVPLRGFMQKNVREKDLRLFMDLSGEPPPATPDQLSLRILVPAFMISELRRAFEIGFLLFLPFLIIDLVVASVLMSMGMMMLPPATISLPFKLIFFVLVDGWSLVAGSLVQSYGGG